MQRKRRWNLILPAGIPLESAIKRVPRHQSSAAVEKRAKQATQARKNQEVLAGSNDRTAKLNKTTKASEQAKIVNEALMNVYRAEAAKAPNVLGYAGKSGLNQFTGGMKSVPYVIAQDLLTTAQGHKASIDNVADPFHSGQSMGQSLRNIAAEQAQKQAALQKQYGYDNFGQIGKTAAEVGSGIVNMAPALALAPFSAGGSLALMGLSAAGSGANKALNEGANLSDAATYGIMTGAKETGTEMLGGGLPLLPGLLKGGKIVGRLPGLTGTAGRVAGNAMDIAIEGGEEALAEYIDPFLQRKTYNPNAKDTSLQEIGQAALLGSLTAGVLKGAAGGVNIVRNGIRPDTTPVGAETAPQTKQTTTPSAQNPQNAAGTEIIQDVIDNTIRSNQGRQAAKNEAGNLSGQVQNGNAAQNHAIGPELQQEASISKQQFADYDISRLSSDARQWLERVGSVSGMNVRVVEGLAHNANGMFDSDGNIVLDGNRVTSAESMRKVLGHEVYHAMRNTDEHKDLQDLAWEWYRLENPDATQQDMLHEKIAQYAENGVTLDNDAAWDEIGAEFSERLMVDEAVAKRVIAEQPNLAQRILRKIQQLLQHFTGKLSAMEQQQRDILQKAEEIYRRGLQSMKYEGVTQDGQQRYMFAGEQSQTADRKALTQAQQMKAAGIDMETIRQETGWFQSAVTGGKWAYEIDDSNAMYRENGDANFRKAHPEYMEYLNLMDKMFQEGLTDSEEIRLQALEDIWGNEPGRLYERLTEGSTQLNDVLEHDALYDAYPQLRNVRVKAEEMNGGINGSYFSSENRIYMNQDAFLPEKTMLHEVQHAIQDIEDFPKGTTPEYWKARTQSVEDGNGRYLNTAGEIMARDTAERRKFSAEQRRQKQPQMGNADTVYTEGGESYAIDTANLKAQQLAIIQNSNPMQDDYHTGIREMGDILTFEEAIQEDNFTPDYTEQDAQNALRKGKITIYSSYPISQGVFVTPSKMEAQNYAGGGRVYSKTVSLADVAWIDSLEGQYAKVNTDSGVRYSIGYTTDQKPVVVIEDNIFDGYPEYANQNQVVREYLRDLVANQEGFFAKIAENGHEIYLGKDLPGEYVYSKSATNLRPQLRTAKMQAAQNLDELIEIAENRQWRGNTKKKHAQNARGGWYKYDVNFAVPQKQGKGYDSYSAKLVIRLDADGRRYLYDLETIRKKPLNGLSLPPQQEVRHPDNGFFDENTIPQNEQNVNEDSGVRYSLNMSHDAVGSEEYKALLDEYGAMPEGENPTGANHRVEVPKSTAKGNQVRQFVRNVIEASTVDDVTANMAAEELINGTGGELVYEPIANKAVLDEVNTRIAENGWKEEYKTLHTAVQAGNRITADDVAMGTRLIQEAQKAGDYKAAVTMVTDLAVAGTELGQSIQAYKMLKRLTPEGQLLALKKAQQRVNQGLRKQGKKPVTEISEETAMEFMQARGNQRRNEIWNHEIARMGQETEGTWMDKLDALRYAAMLSNPRTHIRNITGNVVMTIARQPTILASAAMEEIRDKTVRPGGIAPEHYRTIKNRTNQSRKELKDYAEINYKAFAKQMLQAGGSRYQDVSGQFANSQRVFGQSMPGRVLEQLAGKGKYAVGSMLEAEDMWFKHKVYVSALAGYMRANGITTSEAAKRIVKPNGASIEKGEQYALLQAQKATFTEENRVANAISNLEGQNVGTKIFLGGLMPFKRTPMNIVTRGVEYSPAGLGMTGYKLVRAMEGTKDKHGRSYNISDVFESLAANITGTALMYLGFRLAVEGFLAGAGGDDDKRKSQFDSQMGAQNFAVVDPESGASWTIDWLAPSAMPLFAGVELYNALSNKYDMEEDSAMMQVAGALSRIADPVFEMSCMQGVANALASYSGDAGDIASTVGMNILTAYPAQFVPAAAGAAARTVDDTVRSSYAPKTYYDDGSLLLPNAVYSKGGESFLRQQRSKIPVLSQQNEASIDVWGNERKREAAGEEVGDIAMRVIHNFINPGTYSSNKRTALDDKLEALYEATGNSSVFPKTAASTINATKQNPAISLTPHEYSRFATTKGQKSKQYVTDFTGSSAYQNLDDDVKAKIVGELYNLAAYQARKQALKNRGYDDYSDDTYEKALKSGVKPYEYYATKERFGGKWPDYDVAVKYASAADKIGLSDERFVNYYDAMKEIEGKGQKEGRIAYLNQQVKNGNLTREQYWYLRMKFAGTPSKTEKAACPYRWMLES